MRMLPDWITGSTLDGHAGAHRQPQPDVDLGRAGGGEQQVVEAPVGGQRGQPALAGDHQQRRLLAGGLDQPAQRPGADQVATGVEQDHVGGRGVEQRGGLGGRDLDRGGAAAPGPAGSRRTRACRWSAVARWPSRSPSPRDVAALPSPARPLLERGRKYAAETTPMVMVSLYYWAGARAAAGVESESIQATTVAEALAGGASRPGTTRRFPALSRRVRCWSTASPPIRMILTGRCPGRFGWTCCRRSPAAQPSVSARTRDKCADSSNCLNK